MNNIFLTGQVQIGKSTVLQKVIELLKFKYNPKFGGFCTYRLPTSRDVFIREFNNPNEPNENQKIATWKHNCMESHPDNFDNFSKELRLSATNADIIILDELGFLEKDANDFKQSVFDCLQNPKPCIGILRKASIPWQQPIYDDPNTLIIEVTLANRQGLPYEIINHLDKLIQNKK